MGLSGIVSVPPATPGSQFTPAVYNAPLAAAVASIAATTLVNAPATGTYRISITGTTTVLGTGATSSLGYHTVTLTFTDPSAAGSTTAALGVLTLGSGSNYNGVLGSTPLTTGPGFYVFRAKAGTAIQISTTLTAAGGSPAPEPNIVLTPILELLGA